MEDEEGSRKKHNEARELELLAIRNIMKTEIGRDFMWRCLSNCGTFTDTYDADTHRHAYNAGKRSHGLWLDAELRDTAPDDYFKMIKEHCDG